MSEPQPAATLFPPTQPDSKTRRYDRQLRLWASSGQTALENARVLVLGADATSTAVLKNLVLPGIGHFTIVDDATVCPADSGNNFFLAGRDSLGRERAKEAVRLLREMNDGVEGCADTRSVREAVKDAGWLKGFSLVVAHNLPQDTLDELATTLWEDDSSPPLIVIRSAGFLAEFYIQFPEHTSTLFRSVHRDLLSTNDHSSNRITLRDPPHPPHLRAFSIIALRLSLHRLRRTRSDRSLPRSFPAHLNSRPLFLACCARWPHSIDVCRKESIQEARAGYEEEAR